MDWLTDILQAPVKTVLVVAGIAFIAASILGKLGFSWIALPKRWQRMLAAMFGTLLLILGVALERFPSPVSTPEFTPPVASTPAEGTISPGDELTPTPSQTLDSQPPKLEEPSEPEESESNSVQPVEQKVTLDDFTMTLQKCERSPGNNVRCNFLVTPNQDIHFSLRCTFQYISTHAFDTAGIDHKCTMAKFGSDEGEREINKPLSQDKPIAAELTFSNIPSEIETFTGITVYYNFTIGKEWQGMPYASELIEFDETAILSASDD